MDYTEEFKEVEHHKQLELCKNRPAYRQGRKLTAVKVYTINNESQHLFIYGVPKINLRTELKNLCSKYGELNNIHVVLDYKTELFTECYHVHYKRIQSARIAKRLIDNRSFYGGILHVCYAPEFETVEETKAKLLQRNKDVLNRLKKADNEEQYDTVPKNKRTKIDTDITKDVQTSSNDNPALHLPDIYTEDDPILRRNERCKRPQERIEYGPYIPINFKPSDLITEDVNKSKETKLIPSQIIKNKQYVEKKIIFRKDKEEKT